MPILEMREVIVGEAVQRRIVELVDSSRTKSWANTKVIQPQNPDRLITDWLQTKVLLGRSRPATAGTAGAFRPLPEDNLL
ncbi:hypothetical protein [Paenarthrobacter sp. NPDC089316]|uniref:hypothetical protein n=1 Tax=unclassified Paenarthrobacter TaxID=2634190 RepID=UPI00343A6455